MQNVTKYTTVAVMGRSTTMKQERGILEIIDYSARVEDGY